LDEFCFRFSRRSFGGALLERLVLPLVFLCRLTQRDNHNDVYSKSFNEAALLNEISDLPAVSVEEHIVQGGIGSAVLEAVNNYGRNNKITRLGIDLGNGCPSTSCNRKYYMR